MIKQDTISKSFVLNPKTSFADTKIVNFHETVFYEYFFMLPKRKKTIQEKFVPIQTQTKIE